MEIRIRLIIVTFMALLTLAIWAFPSWWPLINTQGVTERFPGLALDAQPAFISLPNNIQQAYLALRTEEDINPDLALALVEARLLTEDQLAPEANEPFEAPSTTIVRRGTFREVDLLRSAEGEVTIYQLGDLSRIMRIENFASTRAPDVHLVLTRNPDPTDPNGVGVDYIDLGPLRGNVGNQTYDVPSGVDFSRYPILALYSVPYDYVISTATLR